MNRTVVFWMLTLTLCVTAVVMSTAGRPPEELMKMTGLVSLILAALSIRESRKLVAAKASRSALAATTARQMGTVWMWGALCLFALYYFILPYWREWSHFVLAFAIVGAVSLGFAAALYRDAENSRDDESMLKLGRYLTIVQLVGMIAAIAGLLIDPNKTFLDVKNADWAANNIAIFGAGALALISLYALMTQPAPKA